MVSYAHNGAAQTIEQVANPAKLTHMMLQAVSGVVADVAGLTAEVVARNGNLSFDFGRAVSH